MRTWRFYKKPEDKDVTDKTYDLYACTANKILAKRFMKERDMNKFIVRTSKTDMDAYSKFVNDNRDSLLELHDLVTKNLGNDGYYHHVEAEVLCTEYEYQTSSEANISMFQFTDSFWGNAPHYKIYKKPVLEALRVLQYVQNYKIFNLSALIDPNDDDYDAPDVWVDELSHFIKTFKNTFK